LYVLIPLKARRREQPHRYSNPRPEVKVGILGKYTAGVKDPFGAERYTARLCSRLASFRLACVRSGWDQAPRPWRHEAMPLVPPAFGRNWQTRFIALQPGAAPKVSCLQPHFLEFATEISGASQTVLLPGAGPRKLAGRLAAIIYLRVSSGHAGQCTLVAAVIAGFSERPGATGRESSPRVLRGANLGRKRTKSASGRNLGPSYFVPSDRQQGVPLDCH
jgi:hypothetical protein